MLGKRGIASCSRHAVIRVFFLRRLRGLFGGPHSINAILAKRGALAFHQYGMTLTMEFEVLVNNDKLGLRSSLNDAFLFFCPPRLH
jgi:hypothetical protein